MSNNITNVFQDQTSNYEESFTYISTEKFNFTTAPDFENSTLRKILNRSKLTESILGGILFAISIYLTGATVWYHVRFGKRNLRKTNFLCTLAVMALLIRIAAVHILLYGGYISDQLCNTTLVFSYLCFCLNRFLPYVVLWMRQRGIYKKSIQGSLYTIRVKIVSGITLAGIVLFQPALTALQLTFTRYVASPFGCILANKDLFLGFLRKASPIFFGVSALFQLLLLGLVLYPLVEHDKKKGFKQMSVRKTIIRLGICTSVCIISDLAFLLAKQLKPPGISSLLTALFSCCDNTTNVVAMLASFADFRLRFFPSLICKTTRFPLPSSFKRSSSTLDTEITMGSNKRRRSKF